MRNLDLMNTKSLVKLFLQEEQKTLGALKKEEQNITKAINQIIQKLKLDGRVFYIGAGTSGRLGILDASECMPTFSTKSFRAIIAGGKSAMFKAKEGAEDSSKLATKDIKKLKLTKDDIVIGISASGETPYTISALKEAKTYRATTISITSNPKSTMTKIANYKISPEITSEIISGSSRLKSGTAQKIILNMLSSISMIKSGKVYGDLMIDVQPTNKKLVNRAIGIISTICKVPLNKATLLFKNAKKNTKAAIIMHFKRCNLQTAIELVRKPGFTLRKITN